jgi:hypothetical protein
MIAARLCPGAISESSSSDLPPIVVSKLAKPVMFQTRYGLTVYRGEGCLELVNTAPVAVIEEAARRAWPLQCERPVLAHHFTYRSAASHPLLG